MFVVKQTSQPKLDVFQELLSKHPHVFHQSRTPKSLLVHWQLLKQYYLLDDQSGELSHSFKLVSFAYLGKIKLFWKFTVCQHDYDGKDIAVYFLITLINYIQKSVLFVCYSPASPERWPSPELLWCWADGWWCKVKVRVFHSAVFI